MIQEVSVSGRIRLLNMKKSAPVFPKNYQSAYSASKPAAVKKPPPPPSSQNNTLEKANNISNKSLNPAPSSRVMFGLNISGSNTSTSAYNSNAHNNTYNNTAYNNGSNSPDTGATSSDRRESAKIAFKGNPLSPSKYRGFSHKDSNASSDAPKEGKDDDDVW